MHEWIITGVVTFAATNIDDMLVLVIFFSQVNRSFHRRHVIVGQYLGFSILVGVSLLGFLGSLVIPRPWVGLLGFAPIIIGVRKLLNRNEEITPIDLDASSPPPKLPFLNPFLTSQTYQVAAVTTANGGDNIGIYTPLFANSTLVQLGVLLGMFFVLIGLWCFLGYRLAHQPAVAEGVTRYGHILVPFVLIGLGVFILVESGTLSLLGL